MTKIKPIFPFLYQVLKISCSNVQTANKYDYIRGSLTNGVTDRRSPVASYLRNLRADMYPATECSEGMVPLIKPLPFPSKSLKNY
jgi:hypothetical protein